MRKIYFLLTSLLMTFFLASCGKDNKSGGSSSSSWSPLGTVNGIPVNITNPAVQSLFTMPCLSGLQRVGVQQRIPMTVALNATYVGVTSEGDIALITSDNSTSQAVMSMYVCARTQLGSGTPNIVTPPAVGRSSAGCNVDEISAARVELPSGGGYYPFLLNFRPIQYGMPYYPQFQTAILPNFRCAYF